MIVNRPSTVIPLIKASITMTRIYCDKLLKDNSTDDARVKAIDSINIVFSD